MTQMGVNTTRTASLTLLWLAYLSSLASSSSGSLQSCTIMTSVPILTKCVVQENMMRAMVATWWRNISQKSFLFTSKNWQMERDQ